MAAVRACPQETPFMNSHGVASFVDFSTPANSPRLLGSQPSQAALSSPRGLMGPPPLSIHEQRARAPR